MADVQYPYAYDENNNLVNIDDVRMERRYEHQYHCPYCNSKMLPKLGDIRAHCFAHAQNEYCSVETYLHKVAKEIVVKRLTDGDFILRTRGRVSCSTECQFDRCTMDSTLDFDLSKIYSKPPIVEKSIIEDSTRFVPDIILQSPSDGYDPILFEIFVTHSCCEKKIDKCRNILEIRVKTFEDLEDLRTKNLKLDIKEKEAEWYPAKAYNFDDVFFNSDDFAERFKAINPECMRKKDVFQDEFEHMQNNFSTRDAHIDGNQREVSLVWKLFRFGKQISHVVRILEEEINNHNEHSLFEIVLWDDSLRDHYEAEKVLNDVANHLSEYKSCLGCAHFSQIRSYYDQMSCRIRKNGPVGDHSFQVERGRNCSFFQYTRPGYIPGKVKLWSPSLNNMDGGQWEDIDPDYLDDNPKGLFP